MRCYWHMVLLYAFFSSSIRCFLFCSFVSIILYHVTALEKGTKMYCWQSPTHLLFSDTQTPRLSSQPSVVYSSPGLGHIVHDFALYVPLPSYSSDVKELEKELPPSSCSGGFELNPPLITPQGPRKIIKKRRMHQKGDGKAQTTQEEDKEIANALDHPIKVRFRP